MKKRLMALMVLAMMMTLAARGGYVPRLSQKVHRACPR